MPAYFIAASYILLVGFISFLSYTQVDPALSKFGFIVSDELVDLGTKSKLWVGSGFMIGFLGLFLGYFWLLKNVTKKIFTVVLLFSSVLALASFPVFLSNDIFSYLIYGKMVVVYQLLPWVVTPAQISDSWFGLSHWPTSTSLYGPIWVGFLVVVYFLGQGDLATSAYLFRLFGLLFYLANIYLLGKIATVAGKKAFTTQVVYALNPYILMESVANPHADLLMTTLVLLGVNFLLEYRDKLFWLSMATATLGVKIVSLPIVIVSLLPRKYILAFLITAAYAGSAIISAVWSINPWYLYLPITLSALLWDKKFFRLLALSFSIGAMLRYLPYFYLGFFDPRNKIRAVLFLLALVPFAYWLVREFHKRWRLGKRPFGIVVRNIFRFCLTNLSEPKLA